MSLRLKHALLLALFAGAVPHPLGAAEEPDLKMEFVGTEAPSSFPRLLWVHFLNRAYTPVNLLEALAASQLVIDGHPSLWSGASFQGQPGIPPLTEWQGCLSPDDYTPHLAPGKHKVSLKLGRGETHDVVVRWLEPVPWRKGTLKTRLKEIKELAAFIPQGFPRTCVEQWFMAQDGGTQDEDRVRYYLEPGFKVVVPYSGGEDAGIERQTVNGPIQVYPETRLENHLGN